MPRSSTLDSNAVRVLAIAAEDARLEVISTLVLTLRVEGIDQVSRWVATAERCGAWVVEFVDTDKDASLCDVRVPGDVELDLLRLRVA